MSISKNNQLDGKSTSTYRQSDAVTFLYKHEQVGRNESLAFDHVLQPNFQDPAPMKKRPLVLSVYRVPSTNIIARHLFREVSLDAMGLKAFVSLRCPALGYNVGKDEARIVHSSIFERGCQGLRACHMGRGFFGLDF